VCAMVSPQGRGRFRPASIKVIEKMVFRSRIPA
jgi:hypothetical protein